jgi:hypothetical protein
MRYSAVVLWGILSISACGGASGNVSAVNGEGGVAAIDGSVSGIDGGVSAESSADGGVTGHPDAGPPLPDPCIAAGNCPKGVWVDVTPANANITDTLDCSNFGTQNVGNDPEKPSDFYTEFMCQGIWKSTDYGQTWTGPINTGVNGTQVADCAGGITVADGGKGNPPILYEACIRGSMGLWTSTNGGVDWNSYSAVAPLPTPDIYPVAVDPYNSQHLLAAAHEKGLLVETTNGGTTWTNVPMASGMDPGCMACGTGEIFFLDTGNSASTAQTWLWIAQGTGGLVGTWRTSNGGATWTQVDTNEHPHGTSQTYNAGGGVFYMSGGYSAEGGHVLRSTDLGLTWASVSDLGGAVVWGTPKNIYADFSWANGLGKTDNPAFVIAAQPGTGAWTAATTPAAMIEGPAQVATAFDGSNQIFVGACWWAGLWRYIEP